MQAINTVYKIDDGTGTIEARQWHEADSSTGPNDGNDPKAKLVEDKYCRIFGNVRTHINDRKHVVIKGARAIEDYNEIHYHLLEATAVHLFYTKGPPGNANANANMLNGTGTNAVTGAVDQAMSNGQSLPTMSSSAKTLLQTLKLTPQSNEGMHVMMLANQMGTDANETQRAAEELTNLGLIYTTVDEYTFAVLDM